MPQLSYAFNLPYIGVNRFSVSQGTMSFFPFDLADSISLLTMNIPFHFSYNGAQSSQTKAFSLSMGLYSITGGSLSLANFISRSFSSTMTVNQSSHMYISLTDVSSAQNITPGSWWWGFLGRTAASNAGQITASVFGHSFSRGANNFPAGFYAGRMTASTNALPNSVATSDLDIAGGDALSTVAIYLSS